MAVVIVSPGYTRPLVVSEGWEVLLEGGAATCLSSFPTNYPFLVTRARGITLWLLDSHARHAKTSQRLTGLVVRARLYRFAPPRFFLGVPYRTIDVSFLTSDGLVPLPSSRMVTTNRSHTAALHHTSLTPLRLVISVLEL